MCKFLSNIIPILLSLLHQVRTEIATKALTQDGKMPGIYKTSQTPKISILLLDLLYLKFFKNHCTMGQIGGSGEIK